MMRPFRIRHGLHGRLAAPTTLCVAACAVLLGVATVLAHGEAGPLRLARFGNFMVNARLTDGEITGQMYVEFMIPEDQIYPYPVILVHGGGGQGTDWMSTVDGRDGWVNYLVNAGFAVYWIDRPGSARSISNNTYGTGELRGPGSTDVPLNLAVSSNWPGAPMSYLDDGTPDIDTWQEENVDNPTIIAWAATSPTTPFASNEISIEAQVSLLERIGPAVVFTHSAGGTTATGSSLQAAASDLVVGILAFESGGANPYGDVMLDGAEWSRGAPVADERSDQPIATGDCSLQKAAQKSHNLSFAEVRMAFLNSERLTRPDTLNQVACLGAQARESGVDAIGVYMPDHDGGAGTGHFAMSETVNGEVAVNILVPMLAWIQGQDLPEGFTAH